MSKVFNYEKNVAYEGLLKVTMPWVACKGFPRNSRNVSSSALSYWNKVNRDSSMKIMDDQRHIGKRPGTTIEYEVLDVKDLGVNRIPKFWRCGRKFADCSLFQTYLDRIRRCLSMEFRAVSVAVGFRLSNHQIRREKKSAVDCPHMSTNRLCQRHHMRQWCLVPVDWWWSRIGKDGGGGHLRLSECDSYTINFGRLYCRWLYTGLQQYASGVRCPADWWWLCYYPTINLGKSRNRMFWVDLIINKLLVHKHNKAGNKCPTQENQVCE